MRLVRRSQRRSRKQIPTASTLPIHPAPHYNRDMATGRSTTPGLGQPGSCGICPRDPQISRAREELLDIIEAKGKEIAKALAVLRKAK